MAIWENNKENQSESQVELSLSQGYGIFWAYRVDRGTHIVGHNNGRRRMQIIFPKEIKAKKKKILGLAK